MKKVLFCVFATAIMFSDAGIAQRDRQELAIGEYGIHLFFSETEFIDVLTINADPETGALTGHMFVPNDFEGNVDNLQITEDMINFDLFVPKNNFRPEDLTFVYRGQFFDGGKRQIIGYVTLQGSSEFLASFVGFKRN